MNSFYVQIQATQSLTFAIRASAALERLEIILNNLKSFNIILDYLKWSSFSSSSPIFLFFVSHLFISFRSMFTSPDRVGEYIMLEQEVPIHEKNGEIKI